MKPIIEWIGVSFGPLLDDLDVDSVHGSSIILEIAISDDENRVGYERFDLRVVTLDALRIKLSQHRDLHLNWTLVVDNFDRAEVRERINQVVNQFNGDTWDEFIQYFSGFARYEYVNPLNFN